MPLPDQDALNIVLNKQSMWKDLPISWNMISWNWLYDDLPQLIHFTGSIKPWHMYEWLFLLVIVCIT